jgi:hypothetical protein
MNTNNEKNWTAADWHPEDEDLLMLLDGELEAKESNTVRTHLDSCWSCRTRCERLQAGISAFIDYNESVLTPMVKSTPESWGNFGSRLQNAVEESAQNISWFRQFINIFNFSKFHFNQIFVIRTAIAGLLVVALLTAFLFLGNKQTVSASELLDKSIVFRKEKINGFDQPVVYQKFRVRAENNQELGLEIWNDARNSRTKQTISGEQPKETVDFLRNLAEILQKNQMNPQKPLSPESFQSWHNSLTDKTDEIIENEIVTLKTTNNQVTFDGQIKEAIVKFRNNDFHPFEETLRVKFGESEKTFVISEVNFEVVSLNTLKPNFFDETPTSTEIVKVEKPVVTPSPEASESPETSPSPNAANSPEPTEIKQPTTENLPKINATADLEVEVLDLLNTAKADLGEEITVKRENNVLYIRGLVETAERKNEIMNSLRSVWQNQAVRIEIQTVAEAINKQKNQPARTPNKVEEFKTETLDTAAENELVQHFGSESEAKRFASRMVNRSGQVISYAYSLRRMARQLSPAELKNLTPESKAKWLNLIATHARNFKAESESLGRELGGVFNAPKVSGSAGMEVGSIEDLPRAIETLVSLASGNDRLIRSALTISAGDTKFSALKATQFWQSLKNAEALATKIANVK